MNTFNMTCEAVEATLPDYMDETLEAWVSSSVEEHLGQCLRCAALVRDLGNIEREAAALPDLVPVRDLWAGIESRIGTPVVAFAPPAVPDSQPTPVIAETHFPIEARPQGRRFFPVWMAAAAAALVVVTAGTTYLLTSRAVRSATPGNVASSRPAPAAPVAGSESAPEAPAVEGDSTERDASIERALSDASGKQASPRPSTPRPAPTAALAGRSATEAVYDKEILMLQSIMRWRKAELDPATALIIDRNLGIIDAAVTQSRAALRRDPASFMLSDHLTHALDKKVELLRTAAMLPST